MNRKTDVSRRGFLAASAGVLAAASFPLPVLALAAPRSKAGMLALADQLRVVYLEEIEAFAETLRSRFEAGELFGFRDGPCDEWNTEGEERIEAAVTAHFGLEVTVDGEGYHVGDETMAHVIIAASPSAHEIGDGWTHPNYHARDAALWDVLRVARGRGWYTPAANESTGPNV